MPAAKTVSKGDRLTCRSCGLVVVVDTACDCVEEEHEIICCDVPMESARAGTVKAKAKPAPKAKAATKAKK